MSTPTYTLINQITLAAASSSITFSSIPQNYRDLIVVCNWQNSGNSSATRIQLNDDAGANYFGVWMSGNGSTGGSSSESSQTSSRAAGATVGPANTFSNVMTVQFMDANAIDKHKTYLVRYGSANTETQATASRWANTGRISSIRVFDILGQTYSVGSTFSLYGIVG